MYSLSILLVIIVIFCTFAITRSSTFSTEGELDWWQTAVIYQIYPRSFKDSNSNGIGDLKGIEEKAEYLKDLGIDAIWISPIFKSPMADMGYDVSDFKAIDPLFGTMTDFESLRDKLHSLGIKLTLDFVPNHSSDEHEWFIKSVQRIDPYTDYYVWQDPKAWINETTPVPPNNWIGPFEQSMWTYHSTRKQFYLHQFAEKQPDLNYRSKELVEEMINVIRFWLDKGVDGFRMDAIIHLVEDDRFLDEPVISNQTINGKPAYKAFDHIYTQCLPETYEMFRRFREVADSYKQKDGQTRLVMLEIGTMPTIENTMKFYGNKSHPIAHIPFNFYPLDDLRDTSSAQDFQTSINKWMDNMPQGQWPNWVLGNHDNFRIASRFDPSSVDMMNMFLLLLPGTPIAYNGEEIGMEDAKIRWDQTTDVYALGVGPLWYETFSRDPERTPFQWNASHHAGFSSIDGKTWLPVNPNYYRINVQAQKYNLRSHYNIYKNLIKLRSREAFRRGDFKMYTISDRIFAFKRNLSNEIYAIIMNLNNEEESVDIKNTIANETNGNFEIILVSENSEYEVGDKLNTSSEVFRMRPKSAIVLQSI
ncbi:maltase 2-like [Planococcus citri]|uniref:maltase 2-like n=1 Tax=Planococcus citri TaxID=170843 RepID=UPI0031FA273D